MTHAEVNLDRGYAVVALQGEIDLYSSPQARELILGCLEEGRPTLVDLSAVSYIDSSGVASLVEGLQKARAGGLAFALVGVSEAAMKVLQLARLDTVFDVYSGIDACPAV
ncbi:anti-sigma factor antagonist [Thiohalobacter thiocyanaticus]|uniref:Anti-sigma factor antagonist n=1 Tax=Thiohalobacter thiocyanaticus TaxID=585455 RepID=A0A1Z4VQA9_9GAMM|nr:STAS domain-containing protein [Thiohalobacter thiocyanaticus]BAZ93829.1 anti-sigma factor antagonist [Thiohalobacter thiocyanaticus]